MVYLVPLQSLAQPQQSITKHLSGPWAAGLTNPIKPPMGYNSKESPMSSYYEDGVIVGNTIIGLLAIIFLISMAASGSALGIICLVLFVLQLWVAWSS